MILYLDTSALVKLYVTEDGSSAVNNLLREASAAATSRVAYPEARAAFARAHRERILTSACYRDIVSALGSDWPSFFTLDVTDRVALLAGDLAEARKLRGFDAIHLASALILSRRAGEPIVFACWDVRLWEAARAEGFDVLPESFHDG